MKKLIKNNRTLCLVIFLFLFTGCSGNSSAPPSSEKLTAANSTDKHLAAAAASNQCRIRYATGFTVSYHGSYKVVTVFEPGYAPGSKPMATFVLVRRGARQSLPGLSAYGTVIEIPVRRVVLRSSSHVPFFSALGLAKNIAGIVQGKYVNDPEVAGLIRRGSISEVGQGEGMTAQFDVEKLIALRPDLSFSWWTNNPSYAGHAQVQKAGLPVALLSDYEESTPLARTEWIKFVAVFCDAEARAESFFNNVERRYLALTEKARTASSRPTVMYGNSYHGSWYIAGGKSAFANLVKDAGGSYLWAADTSTGSYPINVETAMVRGKEAAYWFTQNQSHTSLAVLAADDSRYRLFKAFAMNHVYSNNGKIGPGGGNDYYQGTAIRPDLLLADMIAIIHPELLPDHRLIWHLHLPPTLSEKADISGARRK